MTFDELRTTLEDLYKKEKIFDYHISKSSVRVLIRTTASYEWDVQINDYKAITVKQLLKQIK